MKSYEKLNYKPMCSGMSFYGLKCTKTHVQASVVSKKFFRLANARHYGKRKHRGGGAGGEARGGLYPHSREVSYAPVMVCTGFTQVEIDRKCFFVLLYQLNCGRCCTNILSVSAFGS